MNVLAIRLYDYIAYQRNVFRGNPQAPLPDWLKAALALRKFKAKTYKEWFEVAWAILKDRAKKNIIEKDPTLRPFGLYRKKHSEKPSPATVEANIRDGIKTKLKRAFKRIAPDSLPKP
jgi:hypothetical protein